MNIRGFTLIELMIALVLTSVILIGVSMTYGAIRVSLQQLKDLTTAQEVLRSVHFTLNRSIRNANSVTLLNNQLTVSYDNIHGDSLDCLGRAQASAFSEKFSMTDGVFYCQVANETPVAIANGIHDIQFNLGTTILNTTTPASIQVLLAPEGLPSIYPARLNNHPALRLDFSMKTAILTWAT